MASKRQLEIEKKGLIEIKSLVEAYEEIAAGKMQKVRSAVLTARDFLSGLSEIFGEVKFNYPQKTRLEKKGKTVAVWISANAGLYGDIVGRSFDVFADFLAKNQEVETVVVGRLGTKMMADRSPKILYNYYDLEDDRVEVEDLVLIMRYLLQYQKIIVFYGQFKSLVNQVPVATSVSGDQLYQQNQQNQHQYLFEPKIGDVLEFFEGQMLTTMFEQTVHESQLAKFASRLISLDSAVENIDRKVGQLNQEGMRLKHRLDGRKQLNRIAGMSLW